ncbi:MAG TPA: SPOR domain-containing protein [Candidatus Eisenbacteria bacterium]|nr:SPOR domain-containing protein [Candidatus Eisenbacteria bacterium]
MAENRKGKEKRYYFSRGQMVLLGAGFTVAAAVIFILGMLVGQGIEERKMIKAEEPALKIPVRPQSSGSTGAKEELTFYETLTKAPAGAPVVEERAKSKPQESSGDSAHRPAGEAPLQTAEKKTGAKEKPVEKSRSEKPQERASPAHAESAASKDAGQWTVQVNAFPDEKSAKTWVDRLRNKGYNAYVTEFQTKGRKWYRVRVGRYSSREEAEKIEESLRVKEKLPTAFATARTDG